ncbi:MAG: GldG family protein [Elainellaceae cyanobacterium]
MRQTASIQRLRYIFWLGPILLIVGLVAGLVSGDWGTLPLALALSGALLLVLWLLSESNALPLFFGQRSTQAGTNALLATVALVVILGLINVLAVRYGQRVDLTENQLFTLSPQTQQVLSELDQPVKAWAFVNSGDRTSLNEALLEDYAARSEQFTYEVVDPQESPGVARQFEVQTFGEVHLEAGNEQRLIETIGPQQPLTEGSLTSGIVALLSDRQPVVYMLQGHGERPLEPGQGGFEQAEALLESEVYQVEPLNLSQTDFTVPVDASVVIVAGPTRPLLAGEVAGLRTFLEAGGGLLLLVDPDTEAGLDPLLEDWNLAFSDRLVLDPTAQAANLGLTTALVQDYGEHPITDALSGGFTFFIESQPVDLREQPQGPETEGPDGEGPEEGIDEENIEGEDPSEDLLEGLETAPLLITGPQAQALEIPESGELTANPEEDWQGPLVIGVALSRDAQPSAASENAAAEDAEDAAENAPQEGADALESRLVAIGNSSFAINGLVNQQLNGDLLLNTVGWLAQSPEQGLTIRPKEAVNRRVVLTPQRWIITALSAVVVLPLIGFGGAIALWLRRR